MKSKAPSSPERGEKKKKKPPGLLARIFHCWMCPLFYKGYRRDLDEDDLLPPLKAFKSERLGEKLERRWLEEVQRAAREGREPSLFTAVRKAFLWSYMPSGLLMLMQSSLRIIQPLLFSQLLTYWTVDSPLSRREAAYYALAMVLLNFLIAFMQHHIMFMNQQFGAKIRIACGSLMYRKILRMSTASLGDTAAGAVVNLMSNDVSRFDYAFMFPHYLWILPPQVALVAWLMYRQAGIAAIIGLAAIIIICIPIQGGLSRLMTAMRRLTAGRTDRRIKLMTEIIGGIQVIKMYAWEQPFEKVVSAARAHELAAIRKSSYVRSMFLGFMVFTERTALFLTVLAYSLLGNQVTASVVYPLSQFFGIIQANFAIHLPLSIAFGAEMFVSLNRIKKFLVMHERPDLAALPDLADARQLAKGRQKNEVEPVTAAAYRRTSTSSGHDNKGFEPTERPRLGTQSSAVDWAVEVHGVSASWVGDSNMLALKNISLRLRKGKLCAIIGAVGSGKSSFLQLLLKELPASTGEFNVKGTISYACQESWLFPATVRENILFGLPYNSKKYKEVCRVCALEKDFEQFQYGDQSLVGERGVSLSGGQRARINLARAVYRDADLYLLDDPLSAVDANVGRQLFEGCVSGYLRGRTRILVTHQIHYLKTADFIVVLNEGGIESMGTYEELVSTAKDFTLLLASLQEGNDKDSDSTSSARSSLSGERRTSLKRLESALSEQSATEAGGEAAATQAQAPEERARGHLKWSVISTYFSAVGSWCVVLMAVLSVLFTQLIATSVDYWISYWTNQISAYEEQIGQPVPEPGLDVQMGLLTTGQYLIVYGCLVASVIVMVNVRILAFISMCIRASRKLHDRMFSNMLRTVMRFFDTSSSGRILNRFSKDMGAVDEMLPRGVLEAFQIYLSLISVLALNAVALPWTLIPTTIILFLFGLMLRLYLNAAQAIKRLEGTTKSPVLGSISSTISGMSTIRSAGAQQRLIEAYDDSQNLHTSAWTGYLGGGTTFGFYLDTICAIYLALVMSIFLFINFDGVIPPGSVGLAVTQSMVLTMMLQFGARTTADVIGQMTAVERVIEYTNLEKESNLAQGLKETPKEWPSNGRVEFKGLDLRYGLDNDPVLKNLNFVIESKWKVGIVGRTGAGKSSLIAALFRFADIQGTVSIDGIDTVDVAKQDLRSKISIIPQEPVLFSATVRYNLDPFGLYSDDELWKALERVELKDAVPSLDFKVTEGGSNFSVGQRQLVCLARAVLRSNKILIMDEATANVDPQTDSFIQQTIRTQFAACTVLTIAHRLNTIMDSDRVLVMDTGEVAEFDHPFVLLSDPGSHLSSMVRETGDAMAKQLFEVAREAFNKNNINVGNSNKPDYLDPGN